MGLDHLALLRRELATFEDCLSGDLSARVEHCGDWTLRDLAEHLGQENLWAATAVTERHGDHQRSPAPADIVAWFADTARILTDALAADPATEAWTFFPPHTVGFWRRRRCLETLVHRWDAEHALGLPSQLDPLLCGDGIAEVIEVLAPRQVQRGRAIRPSVAVRLTATDLNSSWLFGPGEAVATLSGTAAELLLALWGRVPLPWNEVTGDHLAARRVLRGPLVP
ncbi:maleylpyruvate isomerase family mycothiol-dependent enzyme [Saccharopolyspora sp. K220]|uniref:maleylpyruvate isomerase family mycothiol-dependent enzyme n=1 Tax=Saccharopolyspora soli TaxID=2926618 RepID=UPI001F569EAA|nr:maleylpyruvate isomerase family mycothiol-dependent enzyme [Saccharopolyspora soli]MCI2421412.1 maleylpyruvate isomerase family mycothiol-dependent enzyme [Saccharopolyspora soli]